MLASLSDTRTKSQIYFQKCFPNKEMKWKFIYVMPRHVTIEANLHIW